MKRRRVTSQKQDVNKPFLLRHHNLLKIILPIILLLYVGGMLFIATSKTLPENTGLSQYDKIIHAIEFFILIILLLCTFAVYDYGDHRLLAFATSLVCVVVSEIIQIPILNRSFSVLDITADLVGISLGFLLVYGLDTKWNLLKQFS